MPEGVPRSLARRPGPSELARERVSGKLHLVDLAGSEKASKSNANGAPTGPWACTPPPRTELRKTSAIFFARCFWREINTTPNTLPHK